VRIAPLIALLATAAALGSCIRQVSCADFGCDFGFSCNLQTGECEKNGADCRQSDICAAGEICDDATGECRPERLRCTDSFSCPDAQTCNASTGFCEPAFRCTVDGCPAYQECNELTDACEARSCTPGLEQCPQGYVCGDESVCRAGCRPGHDDCPARHFCRVPTGSSIGQCEPNCRIDDDCPFGQRCDTSGDASVCAAEPPCQVDAQCRVDEICLNEACAQPPCSSDADCLDTQICNPSEATCETGDCTEDIYGRGDIGAPNHDRTSAFPLQPGDYTQLSLCPGRPDWFAVSVRASDIVRIRVESDAAMPDLDLAIYDESGDLVAADGEVGRVTSLKFAAARTRVVFLEVTAATFEAATYDLSLHTEFCSNDSFEDNDTRAQATVLPPTVGVRSELPLRTCGHDQDWFELPQLEPSDGLRIERLTTTPDLDVTLWTPDGATYPVSRDEPLTALRLGAQGNYDVRADPTLGQSGSYRLAFEVLPEWNCPGAGAHATASDALPVAPDTPTDEMLCPRDGNWEVDWIALETSGPGTLDVRVAASGSAPLLDVALLEDTGSGLELIRAAHRDGDTSVLWAALDGTADYYLRLSSSRPLGRILEPPDYEVRYTFTTP